MSELPPDPERLRILETYLRLQLDAVRAAIRRAEEADGAQGRREEAAPSDDDVLWWKIQPGHPATLHRGDCAAAGPGPTITRSMARTALADEHGGKPTATACPRCRPDLGL